MITPRSSSPPLRSPEQLRGDPEKLNSLHELQTRSVESALGAALDRVAQWLPGERRTTEPAELARLAAEARSAIERVRDEARDA